MSTDITFCNKTNNECPKRLKCYRYMAEHAPDELVWYGDFWELYGVMCQDFVQVRREHDPGKQV